MSAVLRCELHYGTRGYYFSTYSYTVHSHTVVHFTLTLFTIETCKPTMVNGQTSATHALVILSGGLLEDDSACRMLEAAAVEKEVKTVFIYSTKHGWDFESFYSRPDSPVKAAIAEHEAMAHRPREALPRPGGYEFDAMCLELLRRMRPSAR